jgi:hypothetical protein
VGPPSSFKTVSIIPNSAEAPQSHCRRWCNSMGRWSAVLRRTAKDRLGMNLLLCARCHFQAAPSCVATSAQVTSGCQVTQGKWQSRSLEWTSKSSRKMANRQNQVKKESSSAVSPLRICLSASGMIRTGKDISNLTFRLSQGMETWRLYQDEPTHQGMDHAWP